MGTCPFTFILLRRRLIGGVAVPPVETTRAAIRDKDGQHHFAHAAAHRDALERGHEPAAQPFLLVRTCDLDLVTVSKTRTNTRPAPSRFRHRGQTGRCRSAT